MFPWWPQLSKQRIERIQARLARSPFARNRLVILMWRVGQEMGTDDATHLAAGVAYYAIFSLFPLLLGLLFMVGLVVTSEGVQQDFVGFVTDNLPGSEQFVEDTLDGVIRFRGVLGVGAIVGLLWSASAVFGAISRAVNRAWDVHKDRPFYIAKPRQIGMALIVGVLFLISTSATSAIELLSDPDSGILGQQVFLGLAFRAVSWLMILSIFLLMYRFIPNCKTYWRYIWPGAVVAAVLLEMGKSLFLWYLNNLASYNQFGTLASVMILLVWIYVSSLIVILGAEISSEYGRMQRGVERGVLLHPRRKGEDEKPPDGDDLVYTSPESLGGVERARYSLPLALTAFGQGLKGLDKVTHVARLELPEARIGS